MNGSRKEKFSFGEIIAVAGVVVLIVVVGLIGWNFLVKHTQEKTVDKSAQVITTKADLDAAKKALGDLNFDDDSAKKAEARADL
jgi:hypothetical protein